MRRAVVLLLCLALATGVTVLAQAQKGYVKSLG